VRFSIKLIVLCTDVSTSLPHVSVSNVGFASTEVEPRTSQPSSEIQPLRQALYAFSPERDLTPAAFGPPHTNSVAEVPSTIDPGAANVN
jgi:hypothetical protein